MKRARLLKMIEDKIVIREDVMEGIDAMIDNHRDVTSVNFLIYPLTDKSNHLNDAYVLGIVISHENGREKTRRQSLIQIPRGVADQIVLLGKAGKGISGKTIDLIREKVSYNILALIGLKMSDELKAVKFKVNRKELLRHKEHSWRDIMSFNEISLADKIDISVMSCQIVLAYNFARLGKVSG